MNLLEFRTNTPPTLGLIQRIRLALAILFNSRWKPKLRFSNGVELDFQSRTIFLDRPTKILAKDSFTIESQKHLILTSGRRQVPGREQGYRYGIWENTDLDSNGDPILAEIDFSIFDKVEYGSVKVL